MQTNKQTKNEKANKQTSNKQEGTNKQTKKQKRPLANKGEGQMA